MPVIKATYYPSLGYTRNGYRDISLPEAQAEFLDRTILNKPKDKRPLIRMAALGRATTTGARATARQPIVSVEYDKGKNGVTEYNIELINDVVRRWPGVVFASRSYSNNVHAHIHLTDIASGPGVDYPTLYKALYDAVSYLMGFGHPADAGARTLAQRYFISYDPTVHCNPEAESPGAAMYVQAAQRLQGLRDAVAGDREAQLKAATVWKTLHATICACDRRDCAPLTAMRYWLNEATGYPVDRREDDWIFGNLYDKAKVYDSAYAEADVSDYYPGVFELVSASGMLDPEYAEAPKLGGRDYQPVPLMQPLGSEDADLLIGWLGATGYQIRAMPGGGIVVREGGYAPVYQGGWDAQPREDYQYIVDTEIRKRVAYKAGRTYHTKNLGKAIISHVAKGWRIDPMLEYVESLPPVADPEAILRQMFDMFVAPEDRHTPRYEWLVHHYLPGYWKQRLAGEMVIHALLLHGAGGTGKTSFTRSLLPPTLRPSLTASIALSSGMYECVNAGAGREIISYEELAGVGSRATMTDEELKTLLTDRHTVRRKYARDAEEIGQARVTVVTTNLTGRLPIPKTMIRRFIPLHWQSEEWPENQTVVSDYLDVHRDTVWAAVRQMAMASDALMPPHVQADADAAYERLWLEMEQSEHYESP